jgi:DNA-binding MarR family transcriptional regulator
VQRSRDPADRRNYALSLTPAGRETMTRIATVARQHERAVTAAIDDDERAELANVLRRLADDQGLTPGVHPGYRRAGR